MAIPLVWVCIVVLQEVFKPVGGIEIVYNSKVCHKIIQANKKRQYYFVWSYQWNLNSLTQTCQLDSLESLGKVNPMSRSMILKAGCLFCSRCLLSAMWFISNWYWFPWRRCRHQRTVRYRGTLFLSNLCKTCRRSNLVKNFYTAWNYAILCNISMCDFLFLYYFFKLFFLLGDWGGVMWGYYEIFEIFFWVSIRLPANNY